MSRAKIEHCPPFLWHQSEKIKIELTNLLKKYFPDYCHTIIILVNRFTIGSLFKHKDTLNKGMRSSVVYKYSCPKCGDQYVVSTVRSLWPLVHSLSTLALVSVRDCPSRTTPPPHPGLI